MTDETTESPRPSSAAAFVAGAMAVAPLEKPPAKPIVGFEEQVRVAAAAIKAGQTPSQAKAKLLAAGSDPLAAETAYRMARRRLFESNRRLGARLALYAIGGLCGGTLAFVPLGWTVPLVIALLAGLVLMGVATLVWLTGLGADDA